jgi:hypothetical protein
MIIDINEIKVNGVDYVRKDSIAITAVNTDGKPYVIVRSADSGCHAGYLKKEEGNKITLIQSRRLWYWAGAASLSQLAMEGTNQPKNCKFPCPVGEITIYGVCEKIQATNKAKESIEGVKSWEA